MNAQNIMKTPVIKVEENETVRAVVKKFIENGISGLPIVNETNQIIAYISDGDIMRYIGKHKDYVYESFFFIGLIKGDHDKYDERAEKVLDLNVMAIAKRKVVKTEWDTEIEDIAAILGERQIKKLPVEKNGELVGIISRGDVIRHSFEMLL
ncbi:CBS domain-containing protein [Virgibacillus sp. MSJ-26]|uniref:CBS domain-containing protein n=1 Tax=Virgibacillus sp. MSJ-26 TaxID=2841522 RepID=UPI001C10DD2F|nr:CBS domain-containing protein [Virgibacillus sp. MSJ-26]MBU5466127.1 CBS domain-containing protein [Virgibacillus sp. MSJ-26]